MYMHDNGSSRYYRCIHSSNNRVEDMMHPLFTTCPWGGGGGGRGGEGGGGLTRDFPLE